jgi:hypothetical protein
MISLTIMGENVGIGLGLVKRDLVLKGLTAHENRVTLDQTLPMTGGP